MPVFADVSLSSCWRRRREIGEARKWRTSQHTESTSPISTVRNSDNCFAWRLMHRNADSALKLGQARGAALCAAFSTEPTVFEYAPREVKLAVVGQGGAQKEQVQLMVKTLLKLQGDLGPDAADAIGIALCHAYSRQARMAVAGTLARGVRP
jgi:hypothetical protein